MTTADKFENMEVRANYRLYSMLINRLCVLNVSINVRDILMS
jgi:hypothetical protein